jgi:hypothetical protein
MADTAGVMLHFRKSATCRPLVRRRTCRRASDGTDYEPDEIHVAGAVQNYLSDRVRRHDLGMIEGRAQP